MSLNAIKGNLASYFAHHVVVKLSMSPIPTTSKEVQHLYSNFKTLGNLEYFKITRDKTRTSIYDSHLILAYNPSNQGSLLNPMSHYYEEPESNTDLKNNQIRLVNTIRRIIGIPRYSYIENDQMYMDGKLEIPFKYQLNKDGLKYDKIFDISSATSSNQFLVIQNSEHNNDINDFRKKIRHNFQKFHKFDSIEISKGIEAINKLIGYKKLKDPINKEYLSYDEVLNFEKHRNMDDKDDAYVDLKLNVLTKGFQGFYE